MFADHELAASQLPAWRASSFVLRTSFIYSIIKSVVNRLGPPHQK
jgi:hypothetical protein